MTKDLLFRPTVLCENEIFIVSTALLFIFTSKKTECKVAGYFFTSKKTECKVAGYFTRMLIE